MKVSNLLLAFGVLISLSSKAQFSFEASEYQACAPANINFFNASGGFIYDWDFGDGTPPVFNDPSPIHTYTQGGSFWVTMYAYTSSYIYMGQKDTLIEVTGPPPGINFSWTVACPGDKVGMDVYMNTATNWQWNFDDGTSSSGQSYVDHAYATAGEYHPSVLVTTSDCGNYLIQDTIQITNSIPFFYYWADMQVNPTLVCPGDQIWGYTQYHFSGYSWDFDDGNFGNTDTETWSYASVGTYNVALTITNGCGVDTVITTPINVSTTVPIQNPNINLPDTVCPGETFYADAWSDNGTQYDWDMDDGSPVITEQWGGHSYSYATAGTYNVTCTIYNSCGNTQVMNWTVEVDPNATVQNPDLYIDKDVVCPGDEVYFDSNYEYDFYIDYGDGNGSSTYGYHTYDSPGMYYVTATIQNSCGSVVVLTDSVDVQSNLPVDPNDANIWSYPDPACPGAELDLDASWGYSEYDWNLGDGTTSTNQNVNHIYNSAGQYNVICEITNGCGNSHIANLTVNIDNNVPIPNWIDMGVSTDTICPSNSVFFEGEDTDEPFTYYWDLGDGTTSTNASLAHTYAGVGVYPIEWTITNTCGNDSTLYDTVVVSNSYQPSSEDYQVVAQAQGCVGDELYFVVIPAGAGDITWDFGDGNSTNQVSQVLVEGLAEVDVALHAYNSTGLYWATYTITNACGNSITDSIQIDVGSFGDNQNMEVSFWWDETQTACQGQPVEFTGVGASTFIWDFGDGSGQLLTNGQLTTVNHTYENPGSYNVTVTGVNACGNSESSDEQIFIPQSKMDITTNTVIDPNCGMQNGMAIATVSGGMPPYNFSWTNGDSGVIADSLQSGIYVLTVTDNNGCSNEGIATVSDEEGVTILVDNVVDVDCFGEDNGSISVSLLGGAPPYTILWSNGDQTEDIFGLQAGPYEIFVTDANGCFAVKSIEVTQPLQSNVSVITQAATCGMSDGSAIATVNNGTGPYNYIWPNTGGPSNNTSALAPGTYDLLIIDGNTCLLEKSFVINETNAPIIITDSTVTGTCNGTLSSIYISEIAGVSPYTYNWSDASTNQDLTGVLPGTYTVQVTGNNGCSSYAEYVVEESAPSQTTICLVDVDTVTNTNIVVWQDLADPGIASYNIYKESSEAGLYYLVGNQDADSITHYFDYLSDPNIRSWRYKVAAVDDCGNEAEFSNYHKTIHLTANKGIASDVNLIWDTYEGFSYATYYIERYHPTQNPLWQVIDSVSANVHSYTDTNLPGDSSLIYRIAIPTPQTCTASNKAQNYNSSRSNNGSVNLPEDDNTGSGIGETEVELVIYPNPTDGVVQIRYEGTISVIKMYDLSGKIVYENSSNPGNVHTIDMSYLERGVYNVQLFTESGAINAKVIRD